MAIPRVFVSSTCYDLRYIRENLKYFIRTVGYDPVLSEEGGVFYNPAIHVQDACVSEIPNCQMMVLIIGGKYGSTFMDSEKSITNTEYLEAKRLKIPIFALVEQAVLGDFGLYIANKTDVECIASQIKYPSSDNHLIFEFINSVRTAAVNNAVVPFRDFSDIETYLRQQWAGMMYSFLLAKNEEERISDTLSMLTGISERVEMLSRQILDSVGTEAAKLTASMYDRMLNHESIRDLAYMGGSPSPASVVEFEEFSICFERTSGKNLDIKEVNESSIGQDGYISRRRLNEDSKDYREVRYALLDIINSSSITVDEYVRSMRAAI